MGTPMEQTMLDAVVKKIHFYQNLLRWDTLVEHTLNAVVKK